MSYKQAMKHSRNHRKDKYYQPIVMGLFGKEKPLYDYSCSKCGTPRRSYDPKQTICRYCQKQKAKSHGTRGGTNERRIRLQ